MLFFQVLESEMSNQDSGAKIDGVDVNQVRVGGGEREEERGPSDCWDCCC